MDTSPNQCFSSTGPPQSVHWFLKIQGDCVEVCRHFNFSKVPPGVRRGSVGEFTNKSRMRLLRLVAHIDWRQLGKSVFITLTYPDHVVETTYTDRSKQRYLFMRYVEGHLERQVPALWRVEWKDRKSGRRTGEVVPHLHLLLGGVATLNKYTVRKWWRSIVHVNGPLCTDVQEVDDELGAASYLAKYASKKPSLDNGPYHNNEIRRGRHWGLTRKHLFPMRPVTTLRELTDEQARAARAAASDLISAYDEDLGGGFTLFGADFVSLFRDVCQEKC